VAWPADVLTRTVTGSYLTGAGAAARGRVTFTPTTRVIDPDDNIVIEDTLTAVLNSSGAFSIELPTTDNTALTPKNWTYEVNVRLYGVQPRKFYAYLPYGDGSSVDINTDISANAGYVESGTGIVDGLRGPVGPRGPGLLSGTGAPSDTLGFDDDIYIDVSNGYLYGPKAGGAWPATPLYIPGSTLRHIHTQTVPSSTWTVTHILGGYPSVMVVDTAGTVVYGEVSYSSTTEVVVAFSAPFAGYAYLT
jgi:hypothetical protein